MSGVDSAFACRSFPSWNKLANDVITSQVDQMSVLDASELEVRVHGSFGRSLALPVDHTHIHKRPHVSLAKVPKWVRERRKYIFSCFHLPILIESRCETFFSFQPSGLSWSLFWHPHFLIMCRENADWSESVSEVHACEAIARYISSSLFTLLQGCVCQDTFTHDKPVKPEFSDKYKGTAKNTFSNATYFKTLLYID